MKLSILEDARNCVAEPETSQLEEIIQPQETRELQETSQWKKLVIIEIKKQKQNKEKEQERKNFLKTLHKNNLQTDPRV